MSTVGTSRLERKLQVVQNELARLEREVASEVASSTAAWNEYGSELAVGTLMQVERRNRPLIEELEKQEEALEQAISGFLDYSDTALEAVQAEIAELEQREKDLAEEQVALRKKSAELFRRRSAINYVRS